MEPFTTQPSLEDDSPDMPPRLQQRSFLREVIETLLLIVGIYTLVNLATARFVVEGKSMYPSFDGGEFLIVSRLDYIVGDPQRGDIVVFHYPNNPSRDFIKRVIGLPGETIRVQAGQVYINGIPIEEPYIESQCNVSNCRENEWVLGEDEYFVMGDNRNQSQDSTSFGPIKRSHIIGRAWIKYWRPEDIGIITHYDYGDLSGEPVPLPPMNPTQTPIPEPPMQDSTGG